MKIALRKRYIMSKGYIIARRFSYITFKVSLERKFCTNFLGIHFNLFIHEQESKNGKKKAKKLNQELCASLPTKKRKIKLACGHYMDSYIPL